MTRATDMINRSKPDPDAPPKPVKMGVRRSDSRQAVRNFLNGYKAKNYSESIYSDGNFIFSYGSHFPMAYVDRENRSIYVNTDRYSATTSKHQGYVRGEAAGMGYKVLPTTTELLKRKMGD